MIINRKILIPGFAGDLAPDELSFVKEELRKSPELRLAWGFRPTAKRLSEKHIRKVAFLGRIVKSKVVSDTTESVLSVSS